MVLGFRPPALPLQAQPPSHALPIFELRTSYNVLVPPMPIDELPDFEIRTPVEEPPPPESRERNSGLWIVAAVLIIAAGAALYVLLRSKPLPPNASTPASTLAPSVELGGQLQPIVVPPLGESDPVVRALVRALSKAPAVAAWLTTNDLIRNFTVVVAAIADGSTPQRLLTPLRPSSAFQVVERDGRIYEDPQSYARYDGIADAVASIDPAAAASVYATLKPRISDAYRELGPADPSVDRVLERAIVVLLGTPVVEGPVALKRKGIGYAYADDRLENLTAVQKQLLRMGPRNVRLVEEKLRAVGLVLGMQPSQMPVR